MPLEQHFVAGCPPGGMQRDEVKRCRIGRAVIGCMRDQLEVCELSIADLVRDLAGLRIAVVILGLRLQRTKDVETATGKIWIDQKVLERNDQAVATERSDKPGQTGSWQKYLVIRPKDRQSKRRHVFKRLAIKTVELFVAATDFQHCPQPLRQVFTVDFVMLVSALMRGTMDLLAVLQSVEQAAVPGFAGVKGDFEVESAIGISCFGSTLRRSDHHGASEIAIAIASPQLLLRLRPRRDDVPAAHDVVRFYLEYVGEVATQRHLELKVHPAHAVVGNVEVLVHSLADQPADNETKRAWWNDPVGGRNRPIRKINSRGVVRYRTSIEQLPRLAIRVDTPTADDPCVKEIESLLAWPANLSIRFSHQYRLAVMD